MAVRDDLLPADEPARLAAIRRYRLLDEPPDGEFDRITALAAQVFDVPVSIVSIVDEDRIWFASRHGVEADHMGRAPGLCASAILQSEPWIVTDASADPQALANPLVAGERGFRFYAGAPLTTWDGHNLGTICVLDTKPREVSEKELALLQDLATIVMQQIELRRAARSAITHERERQALAALRKSLEAEERERRRWARELHDETLQGLAAVQILLESAIQDGGAARRALREASELVQDEVVKLRYLIAELRPAVLDQAGLAAAIESLSRRLRVVDGLDVALELQLPADAQLSCDVESAVYRVIQEALTNVVKHAGAERVELSVHLRGPMLHVTVTDDGVGFDAGQGNGGFGLIGMRERAVLAGGRLQVDSRPGSGTTIRFALPVQSAPGARLGDRRAGQR